MVLILSILKKILMVDLGSSFTEWLIKRLFVASADWLARSKRNKLTEDAAAKIKEMLS